MSNEATRGPSGATPRVVTPLEIQQKEFAVSRFGGYRMRDVDEFLDELTESATAMLTENERLRRQVGSATPIVGTPDLEDVSRQADEIIQRARDEAARIIAEAKERAASMAGSSAASAAALVSNEEERAAVNAFLGQEREFLQSLAALVQGHAESVKGMARQVRTVVPAAASAPSTSAPTPVDRPAAAVEEAEAASPRDVEAPVEAEAGATSEDDAAPPAEDDAAPPAEAFARSAADPPEPEAPSTSRAPEVEASRESSEDTQSLPATDATIRVNEPERAATGRRDAGDASLRELFWGDDG